LRLVRFDRVQQLQKDGTSQFSAPNGVTPQPAPSSVRVMQGAIEQSNVSGVIEMSRMIELTRTYAQVASLLQQAGDLRRTSIDKLAEVPA
jgi:flagellar basal body rod protein FlgG